MRILLITGRYQYGDPKRGDGYEYLNFLPALHRLGHEVETLDSLYRSEYPNFIELNRAVLKKVEDWKPDLILYTQVLYEVWTETWDIIRNNGNIATVYWACDDSWKYSQASRFLARHFDACVTTYPDKIGQYHRDGYTRVMASQWAADATQLQPPLLAAECAYDVSFIGACYGTRLKFAEALEGAGIKVACFGYGWPNGAVAGDQIAPILRNSKITLNFSGSGKLSEHFLPNRRQIKARVFEVPGAGGFLLSESAPGLDRFYDTSTEVDVFRTKKQLIEKVRFYLSHPESRDTRARAAYDRTINEHTYDDRMSALLQFAIEQHKKSPKGTGSIDWHAFDLVVSRHTVTASLALLRRVLVRVCSLVFGDKRGPRAARKLLYELSWRFLGEVTYSSSSILGRLFYDES